MQLQKEAISWRFTGVTFKKENIIKEGTATLGKAVVMSEALSVVRPRGYLHVEPDTLGSALDAGLFT